MSVRIMSLKLNRLLLYGAIALAVLTALVVLLIRLLGSGVSSSASAEYVPGTYVTSVPLGTGTVTVQMTFSEDGIEAVSYEIPDAVQSVYPLVQSAASSISQQLSAGTEIDAVQVDSASSETASQLLQAMRLTAEKAAAKSK